MDVLQLSHPHDYASAGASLTKPQHVASFSFGEERELLLDQETKDASLRWYRQPLLGLDLRYAYERCRWRSEELDESLDALIDTLLHSVNASQTVSGMSELLRKTAVISWRGMLTKLLTCVYEEREGWDMNVMMIDGCLYLEEYQSPVSKQKKQDSSQNIQSYFGYSFESYCTSEDPHAPAAPSADKAWGGDVNTNVQWCSIVRTSLAEIPMILGGEVDCVQPRAGVDHPLDTSHFVELKTNLLIEGDNQTRNFERYKMLKHYVQSVLLGVPAVIIGFRQQNGVLAGFQSFDTLELPNLVMDKQHAWHASTCFNSGHQVLTHILNSLASSPHVKAFDEMPQSNPCPVFRLAFIPANHTLALRQLTGAEISEIQASKTRKEERVGFLPLRWVQNVHARKARQPAMGLQLNY